MKDARRNLLPHSFFLSRNFSSSLLSVPTASTLSGLPSPTSVTTLKLLYMRFLFLPIRSLKPSLLHSLSRYSSLASPNPPPMDPTEAALRQALIDKQVAADVQFAVVCSLKVAGAPKPKIAATVDALKALKLEFESVARELKNAIVGNGETSVNREAFRQAVVNTLKRRLFYIPSFKIYRGVAGLYDYGPPGCAVKANVLAFWRRGS